MATSTEYQKALQLVKDSGRKISYSDAVAQVRSQSSTPVTPIAPIQNAPVAGVAPQVTQPVAPTVIPEAKAGDTVIGVNGQKFTQANNKDMTTTPVAQPQVVNQSPTTPTTLSTKDQATVDRMEAEGRFGNTPTTSITPTKTEQIDYTQAKGREAEITANLDSFKAKGMTPDEIMRASDYQNASPEKKALIEPYLKQTVPTASEMYNAIVAKTPISDEQKLSAPYRIAQNRYNRANTYASMTPAQVSGAMTNGQLIEGSQTWEDLKTTNPKLVQDVQNLRIVNGSKTNLYTDNADGTRTNNLAKTYEEQFMEDYADLFKVQTVEEIINQVKTQDVIDAETKANQYEDEMNAIEADIAKIDKDIETEIAGSGATGSRARLEKISRRDALNEELTRVNKLYTTQANRANQIMTQNASALQTQMTQQSAKSSALANIMQTQYQNEMSFQNKVRETEYAQQVARDSMNDPYTAIPQMIEEYKKLGIPFTRSTQQIIQDFESSGKDLATYLSELQGTIQSKPEFKRYQELQQGQLTDTEKLILQSQLSERSDIRNFEQQKEIARLNNDYNRQDFLFQLENDPAKRLAMVELEDKLNANKSLFDVLGVNVGTYEGNRGYDLAGKLGDPMPAGGNWTVKSVDTAGELGIPYVAGTKKPYGNTVVMVDENGNEIRYSHLESIGVKPGDKIGFGDIVGTRGNTGNVKGANGETLTAEQLKAGRGAHLDIEIKDSTGKLLSQQEQVNWLKSKKSGSTSSLTDKQFTQYNQTKTGFKGEPIVKAFEEALVAGGDIVASLNSANGPGDVGAVFNFMKSLDPTSTVREGEFALAAKSAGVWESFKNIPANKLEGTILTDKQRKDFGKLAMEYIKSKGKLYDVKYEDMTKVLKNQGIPESYYPTKMTDYLKQYENTSQSTNKSLFTASNGKDYTNYFIK